MHLLTNVYVGTLGHFTNKRYRKSGLQLRLSGQ